jgi:phosphate transport system protein
MEPHIRTAFDRALESVQVQVMRMGGLVEEALLKAAEAHETRDTALAEAVRAQDADIDAMEEAIQTACARIIALEAPAAGDLRTVLTVMRIVGNLERSGDYAKNLAKRSLVLSQMRAVDGAASSITRMARSVVSLLHDALDAFATRDVALAEDVRRRDAEVDQMYNALFREFLTHMLEDPRHITPCMHLHFIAKNIERVGDHATGIAEQVIYLVQGRLPETDRPKADLTIPLTRDAG